MRERHVRILDHCRSSMGFALFLSDAHAWLVVTSHSGKESKDVTDHLSNIYDDDE